MRAGYRIADRNWRGGGGEIDCIAWDGDVLVFVEVRARAAVSHGRPGATVGIGKQRRVLRAAMAYLSGPLARPPAQIRFDVVEIVGRDAAEVVILRAAFDASALHGRGGVPIV